MQITTSRLWTDANEYATYVHYAPDSMDGFPESRHRPAMIVCAGGGFLKLAENEQEPIALRYVAEGYHAFVLSYSTQTVRLPDGTEIRPKAKDGKHGNGCYPKPLYDLARMMQLIREHAREWGIDPHGVAVSGFSAGGHLCACLATQWQEPWLAEHLGCDADVLRPDAVIMGYPFLDFVYSNDMMERDPHRDEFLPWFGVTKREAAEWTNEAGVGVQASDEEYAEASPVNHVTDRVPPCFIWHTSVDEMVHVGHSLRFAARLAECGVPFEYHVFENGCHGLGLGTTLTTSRENADEDVAKWVGMSLRFLDRHLKP